MYALKLAIRYLLKRKISYFAVLAVSLCVFVSLIVITVLSGLTREFKANMHAAVGDCVVESSSLVGFPYYEDFIKSLEGRDFVAAVSPVVRSYAFVRGIAQWSSSAVEDTYEIFGIDPRSYAAVTKFESWLLYHGGDATRAFEQSHDPQAPGCVPGIDIMLRRSEQGEYDHFAEIPKVTFEINCFPLTEKGALAGAGLSEVSTKTFIYSDHFRSGVARYDGHRIYIPLDQAQLLCGMAGTSPRVSAIHIRFAPGTNIEKGTAAVNAIWQEHKLQYDKQPNAGLLDLVRVQDWKNYTRVFTASIEVEEKMMMLIFAVIGLISVFIVFVVLYMVVSNKVRDIGVLKSVGASNFGVLSMFLGFAFLAGSIGTALGTLGGWQFLVHINTLEGWLYKQFGFQLWNRSLYVGIDEIPNQINPDVLVGIIITAIAACLVGALIPSLQAARLRPAQTLQVDRL